MNWIFALSSFRFHSYFLLDMLDQGQRNVIVLQRAPATGMSWNRKGSNFFIIEFKSFPSYMNQGGILSPRYFFGVHQWLGLPPSEKRRVDKERQNAIWWQRPFFPCRKWSDFKLICCHLVNVIIVLQNKISSSYP